MYRTFVVPLDGSPLAERALTTATALAKRSGAKLALVRVHNPYPLDPLAGTLEAPTDVRWDQMLRRDEEEYLNRVALRVETELGRVVATSLLDGLAPDAIAAFAERAPQALIVMSTHGRSGFTRLWLGSVTDSVVRHAGVPVLMVRGEEGAGAAAPSAGELFHDIVVPLDGSPYAEEALAHALALAGATRGRLLLLSVVRPMHAPVYVPVPDALAPVATPTEFIEQTMQVLVARAEDYVSRLADRLRREHAPLDVRAEVQVADQPASAIIDCAARHGSDLVVMASHGRALSRVVVGSVADKVLRGGPGALLLIRPAQA